MTNCIVFHQICFLPNCASFTCGPLQEIVMTSLHLLALSGFLASLPLNTYNQSSKSSTIVPTLYRLINNSLERVYWQSCSLLNTLHLKADTWKASCPFASASIVNLKWTTVFKTTIALVEPAANLTRANGKVILKKCAGARYYSE
jgi:hypothetical protein